MPNLIQRGAAWLGGQLKAVAGRTVTVSQGPRTWVNVIGTLSLSDIDVVDSDSVLQRVSSNDWLFTAADLPGLKLDRVVSIVEVVDGQKSTWESFPIPNKEAIDNPDTFGVMLLIHTKLVASNA